MMQNRGVFQLYMVNYNHQNRIVFYLVLKKKKIEKFTHAKASY